MYLTVCQWVDVVCIHNVSRVWVWSVVQTSLTVQTSSPWPRRLYSYHGRHLVNISATSDCTSSNVDESERTLPQSLSMWPCGRRHPTTTWTRLTGTSTSPRHCGRSPSTSTAWRSRRAQRLAWRTATGRGLWLVQLVSQSTSSRLAASDTANL